MSERDHEFIRERARAIELSIRIDDRAPLLSYSDYYPHRMSRRDREEAESAAAENERDVTELMRFVAWGLESHAEAMFSWAAGAAVMPLSSSYAEGWRQTLQLWRRQVDEGEGGVDIAPPSLAWLVSMWHREITKNGSDRK